MQQTQHTPHRVLALCAALLIVSSALPACKPDGVRWQQVVATPVKGLQALNAAKCSVDVQVPTPCTFKKEDQVHPDYWISNALVEKGAVLGVSVKFHRPQPFSADVAKLLGLDPAALPPHGEVSIRDRRYGGWRRGLAWEDLPASLHAQRVLLFADEHGKLIAARMDVKRSERTSPQAPLRAQGRFVLPTSAQPLKLRPQGLPLTLGFDSVRFDGKPLVKRGEGGAFDEAKLREGLCGKLSNEGAYRAFTAKAARTTTLRTLRALSGAALDAQRDRYHCKTPSPRPPNSTLRFQLAAAHDAFSSAAPHQRAKHVRVPLHTHTETAEHAAPITLRLAIHREGIDLITRKPGEPARVLDATDCHGVKRTICATAPVNLADEVKALVASDRASRGVTLEALRALREGDQRVAKLAEAYQLHALYARLIPLKKAHPGTTIGLEGDPDVPLALLVRIIDVVRTQRADSSGKCASRFDSTKALHSAQPCKAKGSMLFAAKLFDEPSILLHIKATAPAAEPPGDAKPTDKKPADKKPINKKP